MTESVNIGQLIGYGCEYGILTDAVECVGEVQLHYNIVIRHARKKSTCGVDCGLTTTRSPNPKLDRRETVTQPCYGVFVYAFGRKSAPGVANCNWTDAACFFCRAISLPPKKTEVTDGGHLPVINRFIRAVNDVTNDCPLTLLEVRSRRCCGRMPSGPPADPAGKELIAAVTTFSVNWTAVSLAGSGKCCLSDEARGWRSRRACNV